MASRFILFYFFVFWIGWFVKPLATQYLDHLIFPKWLFIWFKILHVHFILEFLYSLSKLCSQFCNAGNMVIDLPFCIHGYNVVVMFSVTQYLSVNRYHILIIKCAILACLHHVILPRFISWDEYWGSTVDLLKTRLYILDFKCILHFWQVFLKVVEFNLQ